MYSYTNTYHPQCFTSFHCIMQCDHIKNNREKHVSIEHEHLHDVRTQITLNRGIKMASGMLADGPRIRASEYYWRQLYFHLKNKLYLHCIVLYCIALHCIDLIDPPLFYNVFDNLLLGYNNYKNKFSLFQTYLPIRIMEFRVYK